MTERPRAADDFDTIRYRLSELRSDRDPVLLAETLTGTELESLFASLVDHPKRLEDESDVSYRSRMLYHLRQNGIGADDGSSDGSSS